VVNWLLARSPQFRHLLTVHADKIRLEERLHASESERDRLWEQLSIALREKDTAYRTMNNIAMQKAYGVKPFPDDVGIPEALMRPEEPGRVASTFVNGHDEVHRGNQEFWREYDQRKARAKASPDVQRLANQTRQQVTVAE